MHSGLHATSQKLPTIKYTVNVPQLHMPYGRLLRVRRFRGDPRGLAYIVAVADPAEAIALIKDRIATSGHEIEDLGRVSDALLRSLNLSAGEFVQTDAIQHRPIHF